MIGYVNENINPKSRKTCDCVVRAIAGASKETYEKVLAGLYEISVKTGYMINDKHCYEKLLENMGFVKMKQPRKADGRKFTIGEMDGIRSPKDYSMVVSCANHLTCIRDGSVRDIWDCRKKTIGNYYYKKV